MTTNPQQIPTLKKYYYATSSMLVVECSPENNDYIMFTLVPSLQGSGDHKKYNSKGSIKIKMSTEEIAVIHKAINMFEIGGVQGFNNYAKALMRDKYQENWITFYHKSPKFITKVGIGISKGGIPTISVNRTEQQKTSYNQQQQAASTWFPLTEGIRHSFEILIQSYLESIFTTMRTGGYINKQEDTSYDTQSYGANINEDDIPY